MIRESIKTDNLQITYMVITWRTSNANLTRIIYFIHMEEKHSMHFLNFPFRYQQAINQHCNFVFIHSSSYKLFQKSPWSKTTLNRKKFSMKVFHIKLKWEKRQIIEVQVKSIQKYSVSDRTHLMQDFLDLSLNQTVLLIIFSFFMLLINSN